MTQNRYDDPDFFAAYSGLARSVQGLAGAPEWSWVRPLLPPLARARVLDLGCGFGWFCRWAAEAGAERVHGIDVSERMLARAQLENSRAEITYERADLETVQLPRSSFDLAYSSLVLHYIADLDRLLGEVALALVPGGVLVVTMEHPIFTAPTTPAWLEVEGRPVWGLDGYAREGQRIRDWLAPEVQKQHRTMSSLFASLRRAGLTLTALEEWTPSAEEVAGHPDWATDLDRPMFLILAAHRAPTVVSS